MNIWKLTLVPAVAGFALMNQGCLATKKNVREQITPVQAQVNTVQTQTADNRQAIGDLDRQVAGVDEKAADAGRRAKEAADAAGRATSLAQDAGQRADNAHAAANQVGSRLDQTVANLDNYQLTNTAKVYFGFGKSVLTKDEKEKLADAIQTLASAKNYVIEVEGYTDRTGSKDSNVALSQHRADAVLRYLAVHNVPPRKIHVVAIGSEDPNAENNTRAERKENRRVDVRVYTLNLNAGNQPMGAGSAMPENGTNGSSDRSTDTSPQQ
ncbi:MAG: OmpA family protein [Bryobacteraceae bacterium]|jgi:outer membrane protein OmpA-like peptidoglycan-associated protein